MRWTREDVAGLRAAADELRRIFRVIDAIDGVMGDVHASLRAQTERAEQLTRVFDERHPDSANAMRRMMQVFSFSSRVRTSSASSAPSLLLALGRATHPARSLHLLLAATGADGGRHGRGPCVGSGGDALPAR